MTGGSGPLPESSVSLVPYLSEPELTSLRDWVYAEAFAPNGLGEKLVWRRTARDVSGYKLHQRIAGGETQQFFFDLASDPFELVNLLAGSLTTEQQTHFDALASLLNGI